MAGRSNVRVTMTENRILEWGLGLEDKAIAIMEETAVEMAAKAKVTETPHMSGDLRASIHPMPVVRTPKGLETGVGASDYKALWYEKGTKAHANTKGGSSRLLAASGKGRGVRSAAGTAGYVSGVRGVHYLAKALYSTFPKFLERLRFELWK